MRLLPVAIRLALTGVLCAMCACTTPRDARSALPVPSVDRPLERSAVIQEQIRGSLGAAKDAKDGVAGARQSILAGDVKAALSRLEAAEKNIDRLTAQLLAAAKETGELRGELGQVKPRLAAVEADYKGVVAERNQLKEANTGLEAFKDDMHAWSGLGAVWWGIKRLFLRALLGLACIAAIWTALAFFFPPAAALGFRFLGLFIPRFRTT